jgi:hypothetical protein
MAKFAYCCLLTLLAFALILFMPSSSIAVGPSTLDTIEARGVLLWGSDSEGGALLRIPRMRERRLFLGRVLRRIS